MRLPTDTTLLLGPGSELLLEQVWREERLPVLSLDPGLEGLERALEAIGATTVVTCGQSAAAVAAATAGLGFRTFCVGQAAGAENVVAVSLRQAIDAARGARARERWKAARLAP